MPCSTITALALLMLIGLLSWLLISAIWCRRPAMIGKRGFGPRSVLGAVVPNGKRIIRLRSLEDPQPLTLRRLKT